MNRLELGKLWLSRLGHVIPETSSRMRTRMAWHLTALSVLDDDDLTKLPDSALSHFAGGSRHFLDLRTQYLRRLSLATPALARANAFTPRRLGSGEAPSA